MKSNINNKSALKQTVLRKLSDNTILAKVSADTGINYITLQRQVAKNHEYLTLYYVLVSISKYLGIPVAELLKE